MGRILVKFHKKGVVIKGVDKKAKNWPNWLFLSFFSRKINIFQCYIDTFRSYYHPLGHQAKLLLCAGAGRGNGGSQNAAFTSRGEAAAVPWSPGRSLANTRTPRSAGGVRARTAQVPDTTPRMRTLVHTS